MRKVGEHNAYGMIRLVLVSIGYITHSAFEPNLVDTLMGYLTAAVGIVGGICVVVIIIVVAAFKWWSDCLNAPRKDDGRP